MLIKTIDRYFYEKRRDLLILEMRIKKEDSIFVDRELCEEAAKSQLKWFSDRGIKSYATVDAGILAGWFGHYYIDVDPSDPLILEYSREFEDINGKSLYPDIFQMCCISYSEWIKNDGIELYEQHLKDMEDPNYCP